MYRLVAISFLTLYTLVWMRPYFPYLEYALKKDYAVLNTESDKLDAGFTRCEDICYLESQLEQYSQEEANKELPTQRAKFGHEVLVHTLIDIDNSLENLQNALQQPEWVTSIQLYNSRQGDVISPPPKRA